MYKNLLICAICTFLLVACEQQKQASAEVGAIPKAIIDNATNDIKAAEVLVEQNQKALESLDAPADLAK